MTTCQSRRAHPDKSNMQLVNALGQLGKYIWTEYRCPNVVPESGICGDCRIKLPKYKYQANQKCDHGIVGGPYPTDSKLYGSGYYEKQVKAGWQLKPEDELRAKEAVTKACSTMPRKKAEPLPSPLVSPLVSPLALPLVSPLALPVVSPLPLPVVSPLPPKPKKPRAKAVAKEAKPVVNTVITEPKPISYVETMTPTVYVDDADIITVKVVKQKINGKDYFIDKVTGKVYSCLDHGIGEYKGRYINDTLDTNYPDTDEE